MAIQQKGWQMQGCTRHHIPYLERSSMAQGACKEEDTVRIEASRSHRSKYRDIPTRPGLSCLGGPLLSPEPCRGLPC